jgi:hypothetical protein
MLNKSKTLTGTVPVCLADVLRASGIARRRAEEEGAEALFLCERRRSRQIPRAMREQGTDG